MTRTKTPSPSASLHEQTVRQHCRALKMPTVAGQFETLAAIREGHGHVQYLDALLTAEIEERERKGVAHRIQEARLPRVKRHRQLDRRLTAVGRYDGVGAALVRELGGQAGAGDLGPVLEGLGAGGTVVGGGELVAGKVEEVGDGVVDRDEALNVAGRLEPLHLAFSSAGWLV